MLTSTATTPSAEELAGVKPTLDVSAMLVRLSGVRSAADALATSPVSDAAAPDLARMLEQARRLQRVMAMLAATQATLLSQVLCRVVGPEASGDHSSASSELAVRSVAAEFAAALHLSDAQVQRQLSDAYTLVTRFPATHAALDGGSITAAHVRVIVQAGAAISDDSARATYEAAAVEQAQSTTPWRLKNSLAVLAEEAMPVSVSDRHREARRARCVTVTDDADGMSHLSVFMPTLLAHGAFDRIMGMARSIKHDPALQGSFGDPAASGGRQHATGGCSGCAGRSGSSTDAAGSFARCSDGSAPGGRPRTASTAGAVADTRTLPQIAVDVLCDLLLGAAPTTTSQAVAAIRGRVQVTVPVATLAGRDDTGATLTGVGPIDADSVRELAAQQPGWDRLVTDAVTGDVLAVDRYTPSAGMRRFLAARDERCRFPGCRRPTHQCDLDHTLAWDDGGETRIDNLAHLCRRHHVLKHNSAWKVESLGGGVLRWTSPLGHEYIDAPPRHAVSFTPVASDVASPVPSSTDARAATDVAVNHLPGLSPADPPPF